MFCIVGQSWNRVIILYRLSFLKHRLIFAAAMSWVYKSKTNKIVAHVHVISLSTSMYLLSTICRFSVHLSVQYVLSRSLLNAVIWWLVFCLFMY